MKGILFKPAMHTAIREGRKTVTRRLDHLKTVNVIPDKWHVYKRPDGDWLFVDAELPGNVIPEVMLSVYGKKPRYKVGDVVYIKEAWVEMVCVASTEKGKGRGESNILYKLTADDTEKRILQGHWKSPLFLPERFARDFIQITDVRPERLQDIAEEDAIAEGVTRHLAATLGLSVSPSEEEFNFRDSRHTYRVLWDSINKDFPWASNPWVWRIEFRETRTN
jgi:hypothetical protein